MISIPMPPYVYKVALMTSDKDAAKYMTMDYTGCAGLCESRGGNAYLYIKDHSDINTIVHECVHAVDFMFESVGIPCDFENTEVRAYHMGYLVEKVLQKLRWQAKINSK